MIVDFEFCQFIIRGFFGLNGLGVSESCFGKRILIVTQFLELLSSKLPNTLRSNNWFCSQTPQFLKPTAKDKFAQSKIIDCLSVKHLFIVQDKFLLLQFVLPWNSEHKLPYIKSVDFYYFSVLWKKKLCCDISINFVSIKLIKDEPL